MSSEIGLTVRFMDLRDPGQQPASFRPWNARNFLQRVALPGYAVNSGEDVRGTGFPSPASRSRWVYGTPKTPDLEASGHEYQLLNLLVPLMDELGREVQEYDLSVLFTASGALDTWLDRPSLQFSPEFIRRAVAPLGAGVAIDLYYEERWFGSSAKEFRDGVARLWRRAFDSA